MKSNVLHISDLHYSEKNATQNLYLRDAFFKDLQEVFSQDEKPTAIVFSGDIVNNPDEKNVYLDVIERFIDPLQQITAIAQKNIILCPGNHDVSFAKLKSNSILRDGLEKTRDDPSSIDGLYGDGKLDDYARSICEPFFEFCEFLEQPWENPFYKIYQVGGQVAISLNMAFSCSLGGSKADRGKMFFPASALSKALLGVQAGRCDILTGHFPLSDLNEPHAKLIEREVQNKSKLYLFGHVHNPRPLTLVSADTSLIRLQSGALYAKDDNFKGYSYIEEEGENFKATYRSYYDERSMFDEATNVGRRGEFFDSDSSRTYWYNRKPSYTNQKLIGHLSGNILKYYLENYNVAISEQSLLDTYVFPTLAEVDPSKEGPSGGALEVFRREADFLKIDDNVCCHLPSETGATSLLAYLAIQFCERADECSKPRIPIFIDIRECKPYPSAVKGVVKSALPEADDPLFGWNARIEDQPFVMLIDNYSPNDKQHVAWLQTAHQLLPKARFIICAKSPFAAQSTNARTDLDMPFGYRSWVLYPLDRGEVRAIVKKFGLPNNIDKDLIVDEIISKFRNIGIPLSGPIVAMYLTILRERKSYAPINAAAVTENFIEVTLEKGVTSVVFQGDFDYSEQVSLLACIAEKLVRGNIDSFTRDDLHSVIREYYVEKGISRQATDIVTFFCDKNIFEENNARVYFRYRMVFNYLVAKQIELENDFRKYVFDKDRIFDFVPELDIYFGINRKDEEALAFISGEYLRISQEIEREFGPLLSLEAAAELKLPKTKNLNEFMSALTERVVTDSEGDDEEQRDGKVEGRKDKPTQFIQRFKRPEKTNLLIRWVKILACYSVCIKNSDRLSKEVKEKHLHQIMVGWGIVASLCFQVVGLLFENGIVKIGTYEFNFGFKRLADPRVIRTIVANVPAFVSTYSRMYLASGKLSDLVRSLKVTGFADFVRVSMLVDMRSKDFLKDVEVFSRDNKSSNSLLESMMWKLRDSFLRFGMESKYVAPFRRIIAELNVNVLGLTGEKRSRKLTEVAQRLDELRLSRRISKKD
ncbi:hypothetical protein EOD23_01140 [Mesorhizobium sp. USDA-HM6]|nr:hypothetical protein EOD23_01140 [Mesorhizobium sp. USDA-HM6]